MNTALPLLCVLLLSSQANSTQECASGSVRLLKEPGDLIRGLVQYCENGEWSYLCTNLDRWGPHEAVVTCRQLGYSNTFSDVSIACDGNEPKMNASFVRVSNCSGLENTLKACQIENETDVGNEFRFCMPCKNEPPLAFAFGKLNCYPESCINGEMRLMGGANNREGIVEVCMDGRWGTVCNNSQDGIAGDICSELGFPTEGAELITSTNTSWKHTYNCMWNSSYNHTCGELLCDSPYLTVRCLKHQQINETDCPEYTECTQYQCSNVVTPLGVVLGILMAVLVAVAVGWIVTYVNQKRGSFQSLSDLAAKNEASSIYMNASIQQENTASATPPDPTYSTLGPTYSTITARREDTGAYDDVEGTGGRKGDDYQNATIKDKEESLEVGEDQYSKLKR